MVGDKHMYLYPSLFHDKNCKILFALAIRTYAYRWVSRVFLWNNMLVPGRGIGKKKQLFYTKWQIENLLIILACTFTEPLPSLVLKSKLALRNEQIRRN